MHGNERRGYSKNINTYTYTIDYVLACMSSCLLLLGGLGAGLLVLLLDHALDHTHSHGLTHVTHGESVYLYRWVSGMIWCMGSE